MAQDRKISQLNPVGTPARTNTLTALDQLGANVRGLVASWLGLVLDTDLTFSDVATGDVSTTAHGYAPKAPNDATKFLNGIGTYTTPGALVLLEQHTAANTAALNFTTAISTTYDEYLFELISLVPASNSDLKLLVSTDGGATWDTSNVYRWQNASAWSAGTGQNSGGVATSWLLRGSNTTLVSGASYNGTLRLFNPRSSSLNKLIKGSLPIDDNTLGLVIFEWLGTWRNATAVNALQFSFASGNITSGTVRCYGLAK